MGNHSNRSKTNRAVASNPSPDEIRRARDAAKLTQAEAAQRIRGTTRAWEDYEGGRRRMHAGLFELFMIKTGQIGVD